MHLILVPVYLIPLLLDNDRNKPVRFGAQTGRWGDERVGITAVREWERHEKDGIAIIEKCDNLLKTLKNASTR